MSPAISITGNRPVASVLNAAFGAMQGIVVHARTDAAGRSVAVENIDAVRAALKRVIDRMAASFATKPGASLMIKQFMAQLLTLNGPAAAKLCLGNVPQLAAAQNAGLHPGENAKPIGGLPIQSMINSRLAAWDNRAGTCHIVRKRILEPAALKAFTLAMIRKIGAAHGGREDQQYRHPYGLRNHDRREKRLGPPV